MSRDRQEAVGADLFAQTQVSNAGTLNGVTRDPENISAVFSCTSRFRPQCAKTPRVNLAAERTGAAVLRPVPPSAAFLETLRRNAKKGGECR
jgi:hypothetical protein